jgi:hypothetical protein
VFTSFTRRIAGREAVAAHFELGGEVGGLSVALTAWAMAPIIAHMNMCQVRNPAAPKGWSELDIAEALLRRGEDMRCPLCKGPVIPHKQRVNGGQAHFEHRSAHPGCPLIPRTFVGNRSMHPDYLT